jgi:hypothetical protein
MTSNRAWDSRTTTSGRRKYQGRWSARWRQATWLEKLSVSVAPEHGAGNGSERQDRRRRPVPPVPNIDDIYVHSTEATIRLARSLSLCRISNCHFDCDASQCAGHPRVAARPPAGRCARSRAPSSFRGAKADHRVVAASCNNLDAMTGFRSLEHTRSGARELADQGGGYVRCDLTFFGCMDSLGE